MHSATLASLCVLLCLVGPRPAMACSGHAFHQGRLLAEEGPKAQSWNYLRNGEDWTGICSIGRQQSPIAVSTMAAKIPTTSERAKFAFGTASDLLVYNTGHSIQVEWKSLEGSSTTIPANGLWGSDGEDIKVVPVKPFQFHMHSVCEHVVDGFLCPTELHLVTKVDNTTDMKIPSVCKDSTCLAVFGVMLQFDAADAWSSKLNFLEDIVKAIPDTVGAKNANTLQKSLDLNTLLPDNQTLAWYSGSLTTPPCSESVSWHVFTNPKVGMSIVQLETMQEAMAMAPVPVSSMSPCAQIPTKAADAGNAEAKCEMPSGGRTNNRAVQPTNGRSVFVVAA